MLNSNTESQTQVAINELTLYAKRPFNGELDSRPLPDADELRDQVYNAFDCVNHMFKDTRLEEDANGILWGFVNLFHRKAQNVQKTLDKNEDAQQRSQREQDGSEVKSVELEDLITEGQTMLEQRQAFEFMREVAAEYFEVKLHDVWRPAAGSKINHQTMTASMIDSQDYLKAKQQKEATVNVPEGTLIAIAGGHEYNDHKAVFAALDAIKARLDERGENMVLAHCGNKRGTDHIATLWARNKAIPSVAFAPNWKRDGNKRAGFIRNDLLVAERPKCLVVFPGTGVTENLADKAKSAGLHVYRPVKASS